MKLIELKREFLKKNINKSDYIRKIYNKYHDLLFQYSDLINKTDIKKIEITSLGVVMTSKKFEVSIILPKYDHRSAPLECINFNNYEEKELDIIMQILPKSGNFFDIGANIGWHSLIIAKNFKKIKVYSFEPIRKTYNFLIQNIKRNSIKNINPFNFGFYSENKLISFYTYKEGTGNSSIKNLSQRSTVKMQSCHVKIFDNFINHKKIKVDFIKCDVEGAELLVFLGAQKVLLKDKPIVFCEMLRKWSKKYKYHPNEIILLFKKYGYGCFKICKFIKQENLGLKKFRLKQIKKITNTTKETNFFFIHKIKDFKIINKYK
jgi:FkbM family methyltransferase